MDEHKQSSNRDFAFILVCGVIPAMFVGSLIGCGIATVYLQDQHAKEIAAKGAQIADAYAYLGITDKDGRTIYPINNEPDGSIPIDTDSLKLEVVCESGALKVTTADGTKTLDYAPGTNMTVGEVIVEWIDPVTIGKAGK